MKKYGTTFTEVVMLMKWWKFRKKGYHPTLPIKNDNDNDNDTRLYPYFIDLARQDLPVDWKVILDLDTWSSPSVDAYLIFINVFSGNDDRFPSFLSRDNAFWSVIVATYSPLLLVSAITKQRTRSLIIILPSLLSSVVRLALWLKPRAHFYTSYQAYLQPFYQNKENHAYVPCKLHTCILYQ